MPSLKGFQGSPCPNAPLEAIAISFPTLLSCFTDPVPCDILARWEVKCLILPPTEWWCCFPSVQNISGCLDLYLWRLQHRRPLFSIHHTVSLQSFVTPWSLRLTYTQAPLGQWTRPHWPATTLCLLGSQRLTLWTIVPESELPSLSSQPRLFPSVLTLFQSLTRSFISSGTTLHAHISSPYPNDFLWTKISRTAWVWKWIVRESSSVPENTIETTAHVSTGLVSDTQHSWVGLGYPVLHSCYFTHS